IEGKPLSEHIRSGEPWEQREAAELVRRLALALQALHECEVIHRDLKPRNIMIQPGGEPGLMDFGLARSLAGDLSSLTRTGDRLGTPAYMSPELVRGHKEAMREPTDVYSLGVIFFELLTGSRPFPEDGIEALYSNILSKVPPRPLALRADIEPELEATCVK